MNTRLQVEHPVTELVTGIDLVEQMIRVAYGEKLEIKQDDVKLTGWAVESRVYAEDPYRNFLPSIGRLTAYRPPAESAADGITVRNDTGVVEGGEISLYYDPMIAKLVTHGPDRLSAIEAQGRALDAFGIDGIQHNIPFLTALMEHPRWRSGELSTGFIAEEFPDGFAPREPEGEVAATLVAIAAQIDWMVMERRRLISHQLRKGAATKERLRTVLLDGEPTRVETSAEGDTVIVRTLGQDGAEARVQRVETAWTPGEPVWRGKIDGAEIAAQVRKAKNYGYEIAHRGVAVYARVHGARIAELYALMPEKVVADTSKQLLCPMPGLVVSIAVEEGQEVKTGETLAVVEAMKMENVLRAERDGKVAKINAKAGDSLAVDAVILEFE